VNFNLSDPVKEAKNITTRYHNETITACHRDEGDISPPSPNVSSTLY
jgi:hypothetical protein